MSHHLRLGLVPVFLLLCLLLGGASAAGYWSNMILQLLAVPIIAWALLARQGTSMPRAGKQALTILALIVVVILIQLLPLPPSVWTHFSGRDGIAEGYELLSQPLPWLTLSLAPYRTVGSALWLLPSAAILLAVLRLRSFKASWIAWTIALAAGLSVIVGALQITGSETSPWYFYEITNYGFTTGFFSNANHLATLLVVTIPFLMALYLRAREKRHSAQSSSAMFVILAGAIAVVIVGIAINSSLAGIGLSGPVVAASLLMLVSTKRKVPIWSLPLVCALALAAVATIFSSSFDNNLTSQDAATSPYSRYTSFKNSIEAVEDFMPAGSGVGTFVDIYPSYEDSATVTRVYINHVHSDYIELALETGAVGVAVFLLFLVWWVSRVVAVWRQEQPDHFSRASTIASAAILLHSAVDYPLRTVAISAVFAVCCALMAQPRVAARPRVTARDEAAAARHLSAD